MKKITRRLLFGASLGMTQLALLDKFAFGKSTAGSNKPTRLLVLYVPGGCRFHEMFTPLSDAEINKTVPPDANPNSEPIFFGPDQVMTFDGDSGGYKPLRMSRRWNVNDPTDRTGYNYSPLGYSWVHHDLGPTTAVIHGVDNGSVAHASALIGAMSGLAGGNYRSPALVSLVANYLHKNYSDTRPVPCVAIRNSGRGGVPRAPGLPLHSSPMVMSDLNSITEIFNASGTSHDRWVGSDVRSPKNILALGSSGPYPNFSMTNVEAHIMDRLEYLRQKAAPSNVGFLEKLHQNYAAVSRTLALDVVAKVESAVPTTVVRPAHLESYRTDYGFTFGLANESLDMTESAEWILSLMKSNVTSSVFANLPGPDYDTHGSSTQMVGHGVLRGQLDIIARILGEMKVTPSPDRPGCSLYDDTVVVIQSEFNRSWSTGPGRDQEAGWYNPDGHNNVTSVILSGGAVAGNRQIGGFDIPNMNHSIAPGLAVDIKEEGGDTSSRPPKASDVVSTVADLFGMEAGTDYFIPGGYGVIQGLKQT